MHVCVCVCVHACMCVCVCVCVCVCACACVCVSMCALVHTQYTIVLYRAGPLRGDKQLTVVSPLQ